MSLIKKQIEDFEVRNDYPTLQRWRCDLYNFVVDCVNHIKPNNIKILEVSGNYFAHLIKNCEIHTTEIQEILNPTFLCAVEDMGIIEDESYDFLICTEVLEHSQKPWLGADEMYRILKKGGFILITVPCNLALHGCIQSNSIIGSEQNECFDYWRYISPSSIELLFSKKLNRHLSCISGNKNFPNGVGILLQKI